MLQTPAHLLLVTKPCGTSKPIDSYRRLTGHRRAKAPRHYRSPFFLPKAMIKIRADTVLTHFTFLYTHRTTRRTYRCLARLFHQEEEEIEERACVGVDIEVDRISHFVRTAVFEPRCFRLRCCISLVQRLLLLEIPSEHVSWVRSLYWTSGCYSHLSLTQAYPLPFVQD